MASDADILISPAADGGPTPYDFARPLAFAARHLRAAERAHAAAAEALARRWSERFGEAVDVRPGPADEVRVLDYERSRALPSALFRVRLGAAPVGLDLAPALALLLVERHFGGRDPMEPEGRALSDLEQRVTANHGLPDLLEALASAWGTDGVAVEAAGDRPDRVALGPPTAAAAVGEFTVTVGGASATVAVCYPADAFRALLTSAQAARPAAPATPVNGLPLDLRAEFGRTRLPVSDLLRLTPGDVIPLGRAPEAPVPVWIGPRLRFEATPGLHGRRLALHLLAALDPPTDD